MNAEISSIRQELQCVKQQLKCFEHDLQKLKKKLEGEVLLLRNSLSIVSEQLKQAETKNRVFSSVLLQCSAESLARLLTGTYSVSICCRRDRKKCASIILPIETFAIDCSHNFTLFYNFSGDEGCVIYVCGKWTIEIVPTNSEQLHEDPYCSKYPSMAHFCSDVIRLQTDKGKMVQVFRAEGEFMAVPMKCTFSITTRNRHITTQDEIVKRPKKTVFLTSLQLTINTEEYRKKLYCVNNETTS